MSVLPKNLAVRLGEDVFFFVRRKNKSFVLHFFRRPLNKFNHEPLARFSGGGQHPLSPNVTPNTKFQI